MDEFNSELRNLLIPDIPDSSIEPNFNFDAATFGHVIDDHVEDDISRMTFDRRFAIWLSKFKFFDRKEKTKEILQETLSKFKKKIPTSDLSDNLEEFIPDIRRSWAFYEHITLPRYIVNPDDPNSFKRARPGQFYEGGTELYPISRTKLVHIYEFGQSTALYFLTIITLAIITGVAGIINLYLSFFYLSESYDAKGDVCSWIKFGSAYCEDTTTVTIENYIKTKETECYANSTQDYTYRDSSKLYKYNLFFNEWRITQNKNRFHYNETNDTCEVVRNNCEPNYMTLGVVHYVSMLLIYVAMYLCFYVAQKKLEIKLDEDHLTASNYAIEVKNPPKNALNPEDWKDYFTLYSDKFVSSCTIVINNEKLIRCLVKRRELIHILKLRLPPGVDIENDETLRTELRAWEGPSWKKFFQFFGILHNNSSLLKNLLHVEASIKQLARRGDIDDVKHVFLTFETEYGQRNVVEASIISDMPKFMGKYLSIQIPVEPNAVRWNSLSEKLTVKILKLFGSYTCLLVIVILNIFVIVWIYQDEYDWFSEEMSPFLVTFFISLFNVCIPAISIILSSYESHPNETSFERSLYTKMICSRWINTVFVYLLVIPFTKRLTGKKSLVRVVYFLFISEIIIAPLLIIFDPIYFYNQYIAGPRALNQSQMDSNFKGVKFSLADRYTTLTKVLLLCFFYATIYPGTYLLCCISLIIKYKVDKYMLFRRWNQDHANGIDVANISRYFFHFAVLMHVVMSFYWWSGFPYDNVCEIDEKYYSCNQDILYPKQPYVLPEGYTGWSWMKRDQKTIVKMNHYTSAVVLGIFAALIVAKLIKWFISGFSSKLQRPQKRVQNIDFSQLFKSGSIRHRVSLYIPQVNASGSAFPLLACNISNVERDYIAWDDPDDTTDYEKHNLLSDLRKLGVDVDGERPKVSIVKQWTRP